MQQKNKNVAIIGYGNFGKLLSSLLSPYFTIYVYDIRENIEFDNNEQKLSEKNIPEMDYIIFAVPAAHLEESVVYWKNSISPNTIILDVLSVKVFPETLLKKHFPKHQVIVTHPLFGTTSVEKNVQGLQIIISNVSAEASVYAEVIKFIEEEKFTVIEMSPEQHDQEMAIVQALPYFIGKSLKSFSLEDHQLLHTEGSRNLFTLYQTTSGQSDELFTTLQDYNPYAKKTRESLLTELETINQNIHEKID